MGIIAWLSEESDEKDLERGERGDDEVKRGKLEKGQSTETQDTRLTCVEDQPDNPLDVGLFTVTNGKLEDALIDQEKKEVADNPLDLKTPYTISSRQREGEGLRVARGESAFLSKSGVLWVNAKIWLSEHFLGFTFAVLFLICLIAATIEISVALKSHPEPGFGGHLVLGTMVVCLGIFCFPATIKFVLFFASPEQRAKVLPYLGTARGHISSGNGPDIAAVW